MASAVSDLRQLSYAVQAHESVLDILVNRTKECPSLAILLPCKRSWKDWLSPTVLTQNKFMLTFLCPMSLCVVEFGPKGLGMEVTAPKEWVKKWGPALLVTLKVLHVAVAAGRVLGVPIPSLPSSDTLGLSSDGSGKDAFLKKFMASSWDQIASQCSMDDTIDNTQSLLKSSLDTSIPSLESASPNTVKALKHTDEAYKAIHAYLHGIAPIEDLFRGKMSREQYRGQVEWVSVQMVQRWREQIDQRAKPAASIAPSSSNVAHVIHTPLTGIIVESRNDGATTEPVPFPWLVEKLEQSMETQSTNIIKYVTLLVQEGINNELILADISPEDFNVPYLKSIGITSPGVQQHLMRIHKSLVAQHPTKMVSSSSAAGSLQRDNKIVDPADARKVAALEMEVARAKEMAREAAKNAAEMKSNLDAFMDATGVSAGGQMQRAMRTTDGKVQVEVFSPATDQRLDVISNAIAVSHDEIQELHDRMDRLEFTNKKR